jgi:hypothetical protein
MPHEDAIYPTTKLSKIKPGGAAFALSRPRFQQTQPTQTCLLTRRNRLISQAISRNQPPRFTNESLGVEQSGKGRIYSCSPPSSTPPDEKISAVSNRLGPGFRRESHRE